MIYTVTFNPALDYVVKVEHFALGSVNRTIRENIFYGGKGINVSARSFTRRRRCMLAEGGLRIV